MRKKTAPRARHHGLHVKVIEVRARAGRLEWRDIRQSADGDERGPALISFASARGGWSLQYRITFRDGKRQVWSRVVDVPDAVWDDLEGKGRVNLFDHEAVGKWKLLDAASIHLAIRTYPALAGWLDWHEALPREALLTVQVPASRSGLHEMPLKVLGR